MKTPFKTNIVLYYDNSYQDVGPWWVNEEIVYESSVANMTITIPKGFPTDLTTVPKIPFIYEEFANEAIKASVIHDFLYTSKIVDRKMADDIFKEASLASNVPKWKTDIMWSALRVFGGFYDK